MKNKHLLSVVLGIMLVAALISGCAAPAAAPTTAPTASDTTATTEVTTTETTTDTAAATTEEAAKPYIPVISKGFQHQFWQAVKAGCRAGRRGPQRRHHLRRPRVRIAGRQAVGDGPDGVWTRTRRRSVSRRWTARRWSRCWKQAQAKGIPVIGFDSGVDSDIPATTAATDNVAAAAAAADKMAELIGDEGEVAVIAHDQTSRTGIDRRDGFLNRMAEAHPNVTIVDVQYGAGDQLKSTDLAKAIIQAHPNLKGFFGANEGSIIGVLNAVTELGKEGEIVVIGYDAGKQQMDAIRSGVQAGAITQNPVGIGYKCVESAVKAINGEELPKIIDTGFFWYDATNIDSDEIKPLLYE